jgi:hypothetical protein
LIPQTANSSAFSAVYSIQKIFREEFADASLLPDISVSRQINKEMPADEAISR